MGGVFQVSRSGYYAFMERREQRELENTGRGDRHRHEEGIGHKGVLERVQARLGYMSPKEYAQSFLSKHHKSVA